MTEHMMNELKKFANGETFRFDPAVYAYVFALMNMYDDAYTDEEYDELFDKLNNGKVSFELNLNDGTYAECLDELDLIHSQNM